MPLAFCSAALVLLASIGGVAQTLFSPVALRTTFDDLNLTEVAGVPRNALDRVFKDMTVGSGNNFEV